MPEGKLHVLLDVGRKLGVSEIGTIEELRGLRSEWADLWLRSPHATVFQSPDWATAWWQYLGHGQLRVLTIHDETSMARRLVGVAPFCIHEDEQGTRSIYLLGTGNTDYLDILADPGFINECPQLFLAHLATQTDSWDLCDFHGLRVGSPLLDAESPASWTSMIAVQEVCPVLALPRSISDLATVVPAHMLSKVGHCERHLARVGTYRVEQAEGHTFDEFFQRFLNLHGSRWRRRGLPGVLEDRAVQEFHREVAWSFLQQGILRPYGLRFEGELIAMLFAFMFGGKATCYLVESEPEYNQFSPGAILIGHAIRNAVLEGATEFDFLRGREAYKYLWGAKGRLNCRRKLSHPRSMVR